RASTVCGASSVATRHPDPGPNRCWSGHAMRPPPASPGSGDAGSILEASDRSVDRQLDSSSPERAAARPPGGRLRRRNRAARDFTTTVGFGTVLFGLIASYALSVALTGRLAAPMLLIVQIGTVLMALRTAQA